MQRILFSDTTIDERRWDLRIAGGRIVARIERSEGRLEPEAGEEIVSGGSLTPHLAEPHVHLDAALLGQRAPNRSGTLREGIRNWATLRESLTEADLIARGLRTAQMYTSWGTTRIRTHVDTGNLLAVQTLLALKEELAGRGITLQVVAFPQEGILRAPGRRAAWEQAVALGCDAVGAIPHLERTTEEGWRSVRLAFELAEAHGVAVDLHCDETDDPQSRNLEVVCAEALDRGFSGRVVAGHCTALHSYPNPHAAKVIELVAASGVQVVCNPLDNVVLQGRYDDYPRRRGLTRVDELWEAGACVGIGHDSVQDPWYRLGTASLLDAAYMLLHVGHLTGEDQMRRVFRTLHQDNHLPFGGPPELSPDQPARVLWWPHADAIELLRERPRPRVFGLPEAP
ncbi:MAG TPA: cytosine deaminase [Deltaproteobacteria bacterium]|nr:cytosine deaminase [Deltaproteobacteria bacterium]